MANGGWIKVWRKLLDDPLMRKPAYRSVWIEILLRASHDGETQVMFGGKKIILQPGEFTAGSYQIARGTGVPRGTVQRILETFKNEQLIEQRTDRQCTLISVKKWKQYQENEQRNEQRVSNEWVTGEQRVSTKQEVKNEKNGRTKEDNNEFEKFWNLYPRKVSRKAAFIAWSKLKPTAELCAAIFSSIEVQKKTDQWNKDGGRFIPHPSTWLNQERWKDETSSPKSALIDKFSNLTAIKI